MRKCATPGASCDCDPAWRIPPNKARALFFFFFFLISLLACRLIGYGKVSSSSGTQTRLGRGQGSDGNVPD
ncbi:hypothetical protein BDZ91DRAFT_537134 [Kalaharituber pfeilii]|nr:hypothetical protein BDZ91DRAFT_537134 [Kalaharituber pfeilii]